MGKQATPVGASRSSMKAGVKKAKGLDALKVRKPTKRSQRNFSKRGEGLKFELETYAAVSKFTPQTRIKYGPNPKTKGSKSFTRYAKYMKAKTIEEALKLGSKPADLLWEYQRGQFKVVGGPMSDQPNCCKGKLGNKSGAEKVLSSFRGPAGFSLKMDPERRKRCERLAKELGFDLEKLHEEADETGNNESADVQTQRTLADALAKKRLQEAAKAGRKVSDADALAVLQAWGFAENATRFNVMPEGKTWVHSDTLGALRMRHGGFRITDPTLSYPNFTGLLCKWFTDHQAKDIACKCVFTGINVNSNYAGRVHRDANNEGPSSIKALGKFTGGKLRYWPGDVQRPRPPVETMKTKDSVILDLRPRFTLFDGNCAHGVERFTGERFSLVFFITKGHAKIKDHDLKRLQKVGFQLPTEKLIKDMKKHVKELYE